MKTKKIKKSKKKKPNFDKHLGCPSWPICDELPLGCFEYTRLTGDKMEWGGFKD